MSPALRRPCSQQEAEGDPRLAALLYRGKQCRLGCGVGLCASQSGLGGADVASVLLNPDPPPGESSGRRRRSSRCRGRDPRRGRRQRGGGEHAVEEGLGLLGGVHLRPVGPAQALLAVAHGQEPVAAHLEVVVEGLERVVVEGVARRLGLRRPDQGLVGVGEAPPAEVGHRVGLLPDDIVEDPEAEVLEDRSDAGRCCGRSR